MNYADSNPDERTADLAESHDRDLDRLDLDEQRADERSPLADLVFDIARANVQASTSAYQTGYDAGYMDGMRKALAIIDGTASRLAGLERLAADIKADAGERA